MFEEISIVLTCILTALLSIWILNLYFRIFLVEKEKRLYRKIIWVMYFIGQVIISIIILPINVNIIICLIMAFIMCILNFEGTFWQRAIYSVLIVVSWVLAEFIVAYVFTLCGLDYIIPQLIGSILSKILTLLLIKILRIFFYNEYVSSLPTAFNIFFLLISTGSMYLIYNNFMFCINNIDFIYDGIVSSIVILAVNIALFRMMLSVSKEKELQRYNTVYVQQLEQCNQHIKEKQSVMEEFRKARHDMKHHFDVLAEMLKEGKSEDAIFYLQKIRHADSLNMAYICVTDNIFVDSLINPKYTYMQQHNIVFKHDIHIPMILPFDGADICILLGNILDNAIEASVKMPEGQREIEFFMKFEKNILHLTAINTFRGELRRGKKGEILTDKSESQNHGIGLHSIRKVADKYLGSVVIDASERFIIKVIMFGQKIT